MGLLRTFFALLLCLAIGSLGARADVVELGGSSTWGLGIDYARWAAENPVYVGDVLFFLYPPEVHDVHQMPNGQSWDTCDFSAANELEPNTANIPPGLAGVVQPVLAPGPQYYACGQDDHCLLGQKVAINVLPGPRYGAAPVPAPNSQPVLTAGLPGA